MNFKQIFFEKIQNNPKIVFYPKKLKYLKMIKSYKNICVVGNENIGKSYLIRRAYINKGIQPKKYNNILTKDKNYTFYRTGFFFEINCSHLGYKDKHILYHFINDISTSHKKDDNDKIVYIRNIHNLTLDAMFTLRGLIDQFENNLQFIFSSKTSQSIPKSLLSRMILFTMGELKITNKLCSQLKIPIEKKQDLIHSFHTHNNKIDISLLDFWNKMNYNKDYISMFDKFKRYISKYFTENISVDKVNDFRELIYSIMMFQIPYEEILYMMYLEAQKHKEESLLELWSECNHKLQECYRPIFIFELFWLKANLLK
jgi:hypothetical protein